MTTRTSAAAFLLALLNSAPAAAQEETPEPTLPAPGTMSVAVSHGYGSSMIHMGRMAGERTKMEAGVGMSVTRSTTGAGEDEQSARERGVSMRLGLRRYSALEGRIAPFLMAAVTGSHQLSVADQGFTGQQVRQRGSGVGLEAGGGAEWFPVARVGISGSVGLGASRVRHRYRNALTDQRFDQTYVHVGTFTSALGAALYF